MFKNRRLICFVCVFTALFCAQSNAEIYRFVTVDGVETFTDASVGTDNKNLQNNTKTKKVPHAPDSNYITNDYAKSAAKYFNNKKATAIGEVLHTRYFDITVHKASVASRVDTGNQFADLKPEQDNLYLIIKTKFKNIDNESRMIIDGTVWIIHNGKNYEYDKSETIMLDGWGIFLDQINPLITKTTNLVYKIPREIKGPVYWRPGRTDKNDIIYLGRIK